MILQTDAGKKRCAWAVALLLIALIIGTRLLTVTYSIEQHPDEGVFYRSASSVVTPPDYTFQAVKNYPNGAFVFQMPFHFVARALSQAGYLDLSLALVGRLASICYFSLGCLLGALLICRLSHKSIGAVALYLLIMLFSTFQIETSRYGTGDPISFFVLMSVLCFLDLYQEEERVFYLYAAAFCVGILTAIKFPLLLFVLLPVGRCFLVCKGRSRAKDLILVALSVLGGLLVFSPAFFQDSSFFMRAFFVELGAYVGKGGASPLDHLLSLLMYYFVYAEVPLAPVFLSVGILALWKKRDERWSFYGVVLPAVALLFFVINLFTRNLVFRTYYPFFCIVALYSALGLAALLRKGWLPRVLAAVAVCVLVGKGAMFVGLLSAEPAYRNAEAILASHEKWNDRVATVTLRGTHWTRRGLKRIPEKRQVIMDEQIPSDGRVKIFPGEFVLVSNQREGERRWGFTSKWLRNIELEADTELQYLGKTDTSVDYYGAWLLGSTLYDFEMPVYSIYYCVDNRQESMSAEKREAYTRLYGIWEPDVFFEALAAMPDASVVAVSQGSLPASILDALPFALEGWEDGEAFSLFACLREGAYEVDLRTGASRVEAAYDLAGVGETQYATAADAQGISSILYQGRQYASGRDGISLAVYDQETRAFLDWIFLYPDGNGGVVFERY